MITQAALSLVGIALNHSFLDGNKRTGYISGMTFLQLNELITANASLSNPELGVWLEQVVNRELTIDEFVERLRKRLESAGQSDT